MDVGLAMAFAGVTYLLWNFVAGCSRVLLTRMAWELQKQSLGWPVLTTQVHAVFVKAGVAVDLVGIAWMAISLGLIVSSSRQRISISWPWLCTLCQAIVAAVAGVFVAGAIQAPGTIPSLPADTSVGLSLPILLAVGVVVWVTFLVWLLIERARLDRYGPTLRDGLRTNVYR